MPASSSRRRCADRPGRRRRGHRGRRARPSRSRARSGIAARPTSAASRCRRQRPRRRGRRGADRGRRRLARRVQPGRGAPPSRLRPDDARRSCARPSGSSTCSCRASSGAAPAATSCIRTAAAWRRGRCSGATSGTGGQLLDVGLAAAGPASRARSSSSATSRARWSATRGCSCASSRRCRASTEVRTESFVFGTRLTRVTRLLRDRDRDRALARVAEAVNDWAGGTRIGGVVPRVQPALGAADAAHERRRDRRLRRLGSRRPGARGDRDGPPAAQLPPARSGSTRSPARPATSRWPAGMRAAYPYIDDFLPAGTVA